MDKLPGSRNRSDVHAYAASAYAQANADVEAWQREAGPGTYALTYRGGSICYLRVLNDVYQVENLVWVNVFSPVANGDLATVHICTLDGLLTPEEFQRANGAGWPQDVLSLFVRALSPTQPVALRLVRNGKRLVKRTHRLPVYAVVTAEGMHLMDEHQIDEIYGSSNVNWIQKWIAADRDGKGACLIWHRTQKRWRP